MIKIKLEGLSPGTYKTEDYILEVSDGKGLDRTYHIYNLSGKKIHIVSPPRSAWSKAVCEH